MTKLIEMRIPSEINPPFKAWIIRHQPTFWMFLDNFNKIQEHYWLQYQRMDWAGAEKITRVKKNSKQNKTLRGKAEDRLMSENKEEKINWREFLGIVSFTTNSLVDKLEEVFKDNNDQLLDDHEIFYDVNDTGAGACIKCHLHIYEHEVVALSCGHRNVCHTCADELKKNHGPCPNVICKNGKEIRYFTELQ